MICNEEIALSRVNSEDNLINKLERRRMTGDTRRHVPPMIQTLAVETARLTSQQEAADTFGMTQSNVSFLDRKGKNINREQIEDNIGKVHNVALDAMLESINLIKPKLAGVTKAIDLSTIAANLGRVVEKTSPKEAASVNLKVVLFQPVMKEERDYEDIIA